MIKNWLFIFFYLGFLLIACTDSNSKHIVTIKRGDTTIKGDINGSVFKDTILYYNPSGGLIRRSFFKDGKEAGMSVYFHPNGLPRIITYFSNGLKNGYNSYYDSIGKCYYRDFYYYDLNVGPIEYFNKDQTPKRYFFVNLQNETLLDIKYDEWRGVKDIITRCINFNSNFQRVDTTRELIVLLYLIAPPKLSFDYSILKKKKDTGVNFQEVQKVKSVLPFINLTLPILPNDEEYIIGLNIYDSLLSKKTTIYKEL